MRLKNDAEFKELAKVQARIIRLGSRKAITLP